MEIIDRNFDPMVQRAKRMFGFEKSIQLGSVQLTISNHGAVERRLKPQLAIHRAVDNLSNLSPELAADLYSGLSDPDMPSSLLNIALLDDPNTEIPLILRKSLKNKAITISRERIDIISSLMPQYRHGTSISIKLNDEWELVARIDRRDATPLYVSPIRTEELRSIVSI